MPDLALDFIIERRNKISQGKLSPHADLYVLVKKKWKVKEAKCKIDIFYTRHKQGEWPDF